jgi:hypothetical protein
VWGGGSGAQVPRLTQACEELVEEHEAALVKALAVFPPPALADVQAKVCKDLAGVCS